MTTMNRIRAIAVASMLLAPLGASAATRCIGEPFAFGALDTLAFEQSGRTVWATWEAAGTTELTCPGRVLTIDVWEHAVVAGRGRGGQLRLRGDIVVQVAVPDGGTVLLGGIVQGSGPCGAGVCTVDASVQARGPAGERLRMTQVVTIDLLTGVVTDASVLSIVIEFTGAG